MSGNLFHPIRTLLSLGVLFWAFMGRSPAAPNTPSASAAENDAAVIYLPIIRKPSLPTAFGIDMGSLNNSVVATFSKAGSYWVRRGQLKWSEVEPTQGARNWDALADLEEEMINAAQQGMQLILIVTSTPTWARQLPEYSCGPVQPGSLGAFASFMHDLVARYSRPPYNVLYWEIWNEPDASPGAMQELYSFGCWGDPGDPYYGGRYYGDMLEAVSPTIKAANPDARVVFGGLMLDCNPAVISGCTTAKFLEGALRSGAGPHFDAISYHSYDYF